MKNTQKVLALSMGINLILLFISARLFFDANNLFHKRPNLIKKAYSGNIIKTRNRFKGLVREKFSIGISEVQLIKELDRDGFRPGWSHNNIHQAIFTSSNIACSFIWLITWQVDKKGNVTKIDGQYRTVCL